MVHPRQIVHFRRVVTKYLTKVYNSPHHNSRKYGIVINRSKYTVNINLCTVAK